MSNPERASLRDWAEVAYAARPAFPRSLDRWSHRVASALRRLTVGS